MKIAYFGFDLFVDCLKAVVESGNDIVKIFTCKVDGVYESNEEVYAIAKDNNIDITDEKVTRDMITELEECSCDLMISAGYYHKIPISEKIRGVNIHPALLPVGRGPWPQPVTILKDIGNSGITLHKLAKTLDSGDMILQNKIDVNHSDNLETLTVKMQIAAPELVKKFLSDADKLWQDATPQSDGEYWKEPTTDDMSFTLFDSFEKIDRITRAFYGFKCFLKLDGKTVAITKAVCVRDNEAVKSSFLSEYCIRGGKLLILKLS